MNKLIPHPLSSPLVVSLSCSEAQHALLRWKFIWVPPVLKHCILCICISFPPRWFFLQFPLQLGLFLGPYWFSRLILWGQSYCQRKSLVLWEHTILVLETTGDQDKSTFFFALRKEGGSMTEKHIKKTSQWGYARGLSLLYYSCPAVSLD